MLYDLDLSPFFDKHRQTIESLTITLVNNVNEFSSEDIRRIFFWVVTMFTNLKWFNTNPLIESSWRKLFFEIDKPKFFLSTLSELHINVSTFDDCLCLLNGRFNQLRRLFVNVLLIFCKSRMIDHKVRK